MKTKQKKLNKKLAVQICKDAILQVNMGRINLGGSYTPKVTNPVSNTKLKTLLETKGCQVCAAGALLCTYAAKKDFTIKQTLKSYGIGNVANVLSKAFTEDEISMIEVMYEGWNNYYTVDDENELFVNGHDIYKAIPNNNDRFIAIMNMIIRNQGKVKVPTEIKIALF